MKKRITILAAVLLLISLLPGSALADGYIEAQASANVRTGPGLSYKDIGTIHKGDTLSYEDKSSVDNRGVVWYRVEFDDEYAWVSSRYCKLYGTVYVQVLDGQKTYIRKSPSLDAKALAVLHEDELAEYMGKSSVDDRGVPWYKVEYDGTTGWVSSRYTILGEEDSYDREVIADDGQSYIRDYPSLSGEKLKVFREGESAVYLEKSSKDSCGVTWYKVEYKGTIGWVSSRYTSVY